MHSRFFGSCVPCRVIRLRRCESFLTEPICVAIDEAIVAVFVVRSGPDEDDANRRPFSSDLTTGRGRATMTLWTQRFTWIRPDPCLFFTHDGVWPMAVPGSVGVSWAEIRIGHH